MLQKYSRYRLMQEFFDAPTKAFSMRELSRKIKLAQPSVINHLKALLKEGLIVRHIEGSRIRVTIGLPEDNRRLIDSLKKVLSKEGVKI